jgi:hypothetical protein
VTVCYWIQNSGSVKRRKRTYRSTPWISLLLDKLLSLFFKHAVGMESIYRRMEGSLMIPWRIWRILTWDTTQSTTVWSLNYDTTLPRLSWCHAADIILVTLDIHFMQLLENIWSVLISWTLICCLIFWFSFFSEVRFTLGLIGPDAVSFVLLLLIRRVI